MPNIFQMNLETAEILRIKLCKKVCSSHFCRHAVRRVFNLVTLQKLQCVVLRMLKHLVEFHLAGFNFAAAIMAQTWNTLTKLTNLHVSPV
jgi:hypothetical protein